MRIFEFTLAYFFNSAGSDESGTKFIRRVGSFDDSSIFELHFSLALILQSQGVQSRTHIEIVEPGKAIVASRTNH